jgi:putative ABC transport system permease protein
MHFVPILSTLRRQKTTALLIVLEIALTCAIVCNTVFLIRERILRMDRDSGIAEAELVRVQVVGVGKSSNAAAATEQDLEALRAIPGVKSAALTNMVPFGHSSWNGSVSTRADDPDPPINTAMYMGSQDLLATFGTRLIAGRGFTADEYTDLDTVEKEQRPPPTVIITRGIAEKLFSGENAVGKTLYSWGKPPQTIVGVLDRLARPSEFGGKSGPDYAFVLPIKLDYTMGGNYVLRVDPARKDEVLAAIDKTLDSVDPSRIILKRQTFGEIRAEYYKTDRAMAYLLVAVSFALLVITALGVVGLASFWVQQRTRQIGIRRALGATRTDIRRYFQTENFVLATAGIVLGMAMAYAINLWLMYKYEVPRLPVTFLPSGAMLLWILGQIAVLGPAMRAASIPPAIATRSV